MKTYRLSVGQAVFGSGNHPAPERTAMKGMPYGEDDIYQVWPTREAMAKAVRKQQRRASSNRDWMPLIKLNDGEGF